MHYYRLCFWVIAVASFLYHDQLFHNETGRFPTILNHIHSSIVVSWRYKATLPLPNPHDYLSSNRLSMRIPSGTLYVYLEAPKYYIGHYWMPIDAVRVGEGQTWLLSLAGGTQTSASEQLTHDWQNNDRSLNKTLGEVTPCVLSSYGIPVVLSPNDMILWEGRHAP